MWVSWSSGVLPMRSISVERRSSVASSVVMIVMRCLARIAGCASLIGAVFDDRRLQRTERQRCTARARVHDFAAKFVDHIIEIHLIDLGERFAFDHLGEDRGGGLADRAALALERHTLDV